MGRWVATHATLLAARMSALLSSSSIAACKAPHRLALLRQRRLTIAFAGGCRGGGLGGLRHGDEVALELKIDGGDAPRGGARRGGEREVEVPGDAPDGDAHACHAAVRLHLHNHRAQRVNAPRFPAEVWWWREVVRERCVCGEGIVRVW